MGVLDRACVIFAACAVLAPAAHVLEMPNKFRLDGPLWLAVQKTLYNGWGPFIGAPTEIGSLVLCLVLSWRAEDRRARRLWLLAACAYGAMLAAFFALNAPVNAALVAWQPDTLPADWASYRARWELGHGLAALFSALGLLLVLRAYRRPD